jgi:hypothetical protein
MRIVALIWQGPAIFFSRLFRQGAKITWLWLYEKYVRLTKGVSPAETSEVAAGVFVGGQQYRRGLALMRQMRIGATVCLRDEADDTARGVALATHLWLPTPDNGAPTLPQISQGVEFIRQALKTGQGVYIHCGQGVGRAPTLAAAYLVSEGQSPQAALETIRKVRPFITPTRVQLRRLAEWAEGADGR